MNQSGLYKLAGRCALGYACLSLAGYAAWIYASGFVAATSAPPSPERLLQLAQAPASQLSARLDLVSYFLFIPALVGIFAYLRKRTPGRGMLGGAFAALAIAAFLSTSVLNVTSMELARGPVTDLLRNRLELLYLVSFSFMMPGLYALAALNLFWGLALRTEAGLARTVGNLFLAQIAGFLLASAGFAAGNDMVGNLGILCQVLAGVATYATAGWWLRSLGEQEPEVVPESAEKTRAAKASA
jgi:hypothetical protein